MFLFKDLPSIKGFVTMSTKYKKTTTDKLQPQKVPTEDTSKIQVEKTQEPISATEEYPPRILGRAVAQPRSYGSKKSKASSTNKTKIKTTKKTPAELKITKGYKSKLPKGYPASDFLDENGNYINRTGRPPFIDPLSENFYKLPEKIQYHSLMIMKQNLELENLVLNKIKQHLKSKK